MRTKQRMIKFVDGCYFTAGLIAILPGTVIMKAMKGAGAGAAIGSWAAGIIVTCPVTLPMLLIGWTLDKAFSLELERDRIRREQLAEHS